VAAQTDIKGIAVSIIDAGSQGVMDHLKELQKKGVYVLTIDSDGPKDVRTAFIGANNIAAGEQAGKAAAELLPQGGKVVAFVGTQSAANARERLEGFKQGAGPKFNVIDVMEDATNQSKAHQNVAAAIQPHPDANLLLGLWSYNAPAIAEEVERAGKRSKYKIVTFDAEPNTLPQLEKGVIDATIVQQPYEYGFQAVKLLHALIAKDDATVKQMVPASTLVNIPCRTVVSNPNGPIKPGGSVITYDDLKKYLQEKGLKGS
jgi:ribose transport system substrate-binding protein